MSHIEPDAGFGGQDITYEDGPPKRDEMNGDELIRLYADPREVIYAALNTAIDHWTGSLPAEALASFQRVRHVFEKAVEYGDTVVFTGNQPVDVIGLQADGTVITPADE